MKDIRQSPQFAAFMKDLGWQVKEIDDTFIYMMHFPFIGYFAKIPRPDPFFPLSKIINLKKTNHIFKLKIAPNITHYKKDYQKYRKEFFHQDFQIEQSPFNPTTTIHIDLTQKEENIFSQFSSAKRRAVRRAIKNGIVIKESTDFKSFIEIRKNQYFPCGFLITKEMHKLWKNFYPQNASLLLAYQKNDNKPLSGILLLFYDQVAYYWYASSLKIGKKLFAPTLLVWEALKISTKRGCRVFDFEGIYDERFPKAAAGWIGFTKFKEGFGGKRITFLENFKNN